MKSLAEAIVYAVVYIDLREDLEEAFLEEDVGALESISYYLNQATDAEKDALAAAAESALARAQAATRPRKKLIQAYRTWMEDMFPDEGWVGNKRSSKRSKK